MENYVNNAEKVKESEIKELIENNVEKIKEKGLKILNSIEGMIIVKEYLFLN
ncbi:MAG: hypothetical protein ACTSRI_21585 [Promethearchaeota archaeon]